MTQPVLFCENDLLLNDTDPELPYRRRQDEEKKAIHMGQRKLCLTVLQFITIYWDPITKPVVVYAGAAPGININIIADLYPNTEFHLYDPADFKVKPRSNIHLYQQYFTDTEAREWAIKKIPLLFISDIRTADYTQAKNLDENEDQISGDMDAQMRWYNIIKPISAQLKFRLPYTGGSRPLSVDYLDGIIYKQPWAPQTSTETRLVPIGPGIMKKWDCTKYQSQMFYHNVTVRETFVYSNPFLEVTEKLISNSDPDKALIDPPELLNDYDSLAETNILLSYLNKVKKDLPDEMGPETKVLSEGNQLEQIQKLSRRITNSLTEKGKKVTLKFLRSNPRYIKDKHIVRDQEIRPDRPVKTVKPKAEQISEDFNSNEPLKKTPTKKARSRIIR